MEEIITLVKEHLFPSFSLFFPFLYSEVILQGLQARISGHVCVE